MTIAAHSGISKSAAYHRSEKGHIWGVCSSSIAPSSPPPSSSVGRSRVRAVTPLRVPPGKKDMDGMRETVRQAAPAPGGKTPACTAARHTAEVSE